MKNHEKLQATGKKRCNQCKKLLPRDAFGLDARSRDGLHRRCRSCAKEHKQIRKARATAPPTPVNIVRVRNMYSISMSAYLELFMAQGGVCAICKMPEKRRARDGKPVALSVDHDHRTGDVRGLLCQTCNTMIGFAADDPSRLRAGAEYLDQSQDRKVV